MPIGWAEHDDWYVEAHRDRHLRRPSHHRMDTGVRHHSAYLHPEISGMSTRHRSRSQGHDPRPNIHIYNRLDADNLAPPHAPMPHHLSPADAMAEQLRLEQMMLIRQPSRSRSRSRSGSPAVHSVQMLQEKIRDLEARQFIMAEDERMRAEIELDRLRNLLSHEHHYGSHRQEDDKWKNEWKYRQMKDENRRIKEAKDAEDQKAAILAEHEMQMKAAEDAKKAAIAEHTRKKAEEAAKAKAEEEALRAKIKREELEEKEKAEKAYKEFVLKQKEKEIKEKEKKKKKEAEVNEELAKRLSGLGIPQSQIEAMVNPKAAGSVQHVHPITATTTTALMPVGNHGHPTRYIKVRCDLISAETLQYYNIPWQWDSVSDARTSLE